MTGPGVSTAAPAGRGAPTPPAGRGDPGWRRVLRAPETVTAAMLLAALAVGALTTPAFWDPSSLLANTSSYVEIGIIALPMTLVVVNGDIDLSVASMVTLSAAVLGSTYQAGLPVAASCALAVLSGGALGALNGILVTCFGLPSLVVTLGTLALYQGIAEIMLTDRSISGFPDSFVGFDRYGLFGTRPDLPSPVAVLLLLAAAFWFLLHRTVYGRLCHLVGSNTVAAHYCGIRTRLVRGVAFTLTGAACGLAAVLLTSRLAATRTDLATGMELLVITVVVLGGTDIFGGRGSMAAIVLAFFAVVAIRQAMTVASVNGQTQNAVVGALLIAAILLPATVGRLATRARRRRAPGTAAPDAP